MLARISSRRPWITVGVWAVLVLLAMALIGELLGSATTTDFRLAGRYESERASALLEDRLRGPKPLAELVIVQSPSLTVDDDAFRAKVDAVHAAISGDRTGDDCRGHRWATDIPLLPSPRGHKHSSLRSSGSSYSPCWFRLTSGPC